MANLPETLNTNLGNLKTVYVDELQKVLPEAAILQKRFPLAKDGMFPPIGDYLSAVVAVKQPWGVVMQGIGNEAGWSGALSPALAGQTLPAQIYGNSTLIRDQIQYVLLDRAAKSNSVQAVMASLKLMTSEMATTLRNVLELQILHGRQGIGTASAPISTLTVAFDPATTSAGILSILQGARVLFVQSDNVTARTANDLNNYLTVASIDVSNQAAPTITLTATGTTGVASVTSTDIMYLATARTGQAPVAVGDTLGFTEQIGLGYQLAQTSGTVFGIDKAANIGWKANQIPSVGVANPSILNGAAALIQGRGAMAGRYLVVLSPRAWGTVNSSLATQQNYPSAPGNPKSEMQSGTDSIVINNNGIEMELVSHPFQKDGQMYVFPEDEFHRVGSTDVTASVPGKTGSEEFLYPVPDSSLMESQMRSDFQCVLLRPPSGVILTGVTY